MPVKSKRQFRLMQAAKHGKLKKKGGPSRAVAKEMLSVAVDYKDLPETKKAPSPKTSGRSKRAAGRKAKAAARKRGR